MIRLNELVDSLNDLSIKVIVDDEDTYYEEDNPIIYTGKVTDFRPRYREFDKYYVLSIWKSHENNNDLNIFVREE